MSSREMSQRSAIISAPRNWLTSPLPNREVHPDDPVNGSKSGSSLPAWDPAVIGTIDMFSTPPATTTSIVPDITA